MTDLKSIHQARALESMKALFAKDKGQHLLLLTSSSDQGVIRNNGRNGARYAPQSFLFHFKKMTQDQEMKNWRFTQVEVASSAEEVKDFKQAQIIEAEKIIESNPLDHDFICHLGGGHDHIYPLLHKLHPQFENTIIINIDAHADTRTDAEFHSGTPFRQLDSEIKHLQLFQIGLHPYSNSFSTLSPLKTEMNILWKQDCTPLLMGAFFEKMKAFIGPKTLVIFSLDADALCGYQVPGVSAVNADGLTLDTLKELMTHYLALPFNHAPVLGIYELNPVYDHLSGVSMNTLANFLFHTIKLIKTSE